MGGEGGGGGRGEGGWIGCLVTPLCGFNNCGQKQLMEHSHFHGNFALIKTVHTLCS